LKTTFYIPKGNWPLNFEVYSSFFKKLGYTQREDEGDFLVLPGGSDLGVRPNRDLFESENYANYITKGRPIAAICRGMQLSIVDDGGILIPHIPDVLEDIKHTTLTGHWKGQSTWHKTSLGFLTNSRHHQGFTDIPDGWTVLDKTSDGIIEAATDGHTLAVQWHPEREEMWKTNALDWYVEELQKML
jgi:gamma-glutamyl-gamma-aminobutyrate hydrolase PuuD